MSTIGTFILSPKEKRQYTIGYSKWLDTDEVIGSLTWENDPAFSVAAIINPDQLGVSVTVGPGGISGDEFGVSIIISTTAGQIKEDCIIFTIEESCE